MEPIRLTPFNALSTNADLWVVSNIEKSKWTQEIDYYINFQITNAQNRQRAALDSHIENILNAEQENPPTIADGPLMIAPQSHLPARCLLYLKNTESPRDWLKKAHEVWLSLKRPSVKLFLPTNISKTDVETYWENMESPVYIVENEL